MVFENYRGSIIFAHITFIFFCLFFLLKLFSPISFLIGVVFGWLLLYSPIFNSLREIVFIKFKKFIDINYFIFTTEKPSKESFSTINNNIFQQLSKKETFYSEILKKESKISDIMLKCLNKTVEQEACLSEIDEKNDNILEIYSRIKALQENREKLSEALIDNIRNNKTTYW